MNEENSLVSAKSAIVPHKTSSSSTSMNLFQRASLSGTFLVLTGILGGFVFSIDQDTAYIPYEYAKTHIPVLLLGTFILLIRIKFLFDNHKYFADPQQDQLVSRMFCFIIASMCWVLFAAAAGTISKPDISVEFIIYGFIVSTCWLAFHLMEPVEAQIRKKCFKDQCVEIKHHWIYFNIIYIIISMSYLDWWGISQYTSFLTKNKNDYLWFLIVVLLFDYMLSDSYINLLNNDDLDNKCKTLKEDKSDSA